MTESNNNTGSDHLEVTDVLSQIDVSETAHGVHSAMSPVAESKPTGAAPASSTLGDLPVVAQTPAPKSSNSFDIVFALSSEREAALRERKMYKDRATAAEARVAQLESELAAARTEAKSSGEHGAAGEGDMVATLKRRLQERDNRIAQLESQLADHAGAPTLVGGELELIAAGIAPKIVYALESLENSTETYKLTRPTNTVGRSKDNDVYLASNSVSRFHAKLLNKSDGLWLIDQQSINGCRVNGKRVTEQVLNDGDLVMIGHCRFRFSKLES